MPLYEYECAVCGNFTEMRPVHDRDRVASCPICQCRASRTIQAPNLALVANSVRRAAAINEQSQHAPRVQNRHRCSYGCGCGTRKKRATAPSAGETKPRLQSGRVGQRPWMLGH